MSSQQNYETRFVSIIIEKKSTKLTIIVANVFLSILQIQANVDDR